jgi:hypothetical protein
MIIMLVGFDKKFVNNDFDDYKSIIKINFRKSRFTEFIYAVSFISLGALILFSYLKSS